MGLSVGRQCRVTPGCVPGSSGRTCMSPNVPLGPRPPLRAGRTRAPWSLQLGTRGSLLGQLGPPSILQRPESRGVTRVLLAERASGAWGLGPHKSKEKYVCCIISY